MLEKDSRFEKGNAREALHGLVDEMDKERVREMLPDVETELYVKRISNSKV